MYGGDKDIDHANAMADQNRDADFERWFDSRLAPENNPNESEARETPKSSR